MKRINQVIALLVVVFTANVRADIAFSDYYGTNFNTNWAIGGATGSGFTEYYGTPAPEVWSAYQFTSEATGPLERVTLSLIGHPYDKETYSGYVNPDTDYSVKVLIYADAADHLGGVLQSWDAIGIRTDAIGNYAFINTDDAVMLYRGQKYWIGLLPYSPYSNVAWYGAYAGQPESNYCEYYENRNGTGPGPEDLMYSWTTQPGTMLVTVKPLGDYDGNGKVDLLDVLDLSLHWLDADSPYDVTGDGLVNLEDFAVLSGRFQL